MNQGRFITLEGGEGVGKTTNLQFIRDRLSQQGIAHIVTREPGGTPFAEKIRGILLEPHDEPVHEQAELLLVFAARAQHIHQVILPALKQGKWVLCDRFTDATYAYQGGGRRMDMQAIAWLEAAVQGSLRPDLTILLDAPVEIGMRRAKHRGELDRFEAEQIDFFERVRAVYLQRAAREEPRYRIIDASQPLSAVQAQISRTLASLTNS